MITHQRFLLRQEEFIKEDNLWYKLTFFNDESAKIETVEVKDPEKKVIIENHKRDLEIEDALQGY